MRARFDFRPTPNRQPLLFESPERVVVARSLDDVLPAMAAVEEGLRQGLHAAGYVGYEAAAAFDRALVTQAGTGVPLLCFGLYRSPEVAPPLSELALPQPASWQSAISAEDHARGIAAVREAIAAGDTYQINYTFRLQSVLDPVTLDALYAHLVQAVQVPYAAHLDLGEEWGGWHLLSLSPELFFSLEHGRLVTRPMKGTAPRGRWATEDQARRAALAHSIKNQAENVMIVDLCRNDLSRVCEVGSVVAHSLFEVEPYPTVWQMVSTVEGRLREGVGLSDIFSALFPAGSITGAPKSSSMRLIAALEHAPRGAYCGAIGHVSPDGHATFNVAIRTITVEGRTGASVYGVGGGITWDSVAADEHAEAMAKAACLDVRPPFSLLETLRLDAGTYARLDRHLDRLQTSARYFGFTCDLAAIRATLEAHATVCGSGGHRVRLLLTARGYVGVQSEAADLFRPFNSDSSHDAVERIAVAADAVDSRDRFLCHKTTRREVYDQQFQRHCASGDVFDVLLWNERGEVTEFTRGNLVLELDGVRCTPPRESGLLAGVLRAALLDQGAIVERVLTRDDVNRATRIWFINSVRGWIPGSHAGRYGR